MTPISGKTYRQKVDSQQGYEDWEYTGSTIKHQMEMCYMHSKMTLVFITLIKKI